MTTEAAQLQFAAEFTLFIAALAALAVTALKPELLFRDAVARIVFQLGAFGLAVAAFVHGSLLVDDATDPVLVLARASGIVLIGISLLRWTGPGNARSLAVLGIVALAVAEAVTSSGSESLGDGVRGVGALVFAVALVVASRGAIAARVATSAAAVVLLVITALAIALSVVIAENVEDEVARRYAARAETEAQLVADSSRSLPAEASLLARSLSVDQFRSAIATVNAAPDPATVAQARQTVADRLAEFRDTLLRDAFGGPLLVVGSTGAPVADIGASPVARIELIGSDVVREVIETRQPADDVAIVGDQTFAIGAAPIVVEAEFLGVAVVTSRLDGSYLASRIDDPSSEEQELGLALADRRRVYATAGRQPDLETNLTLAGQVLREGERHTAVDGGRFVVGLPVRDELGAPVLALMVAVPEGRIDATRQDLFELLFIVALGAALAAMLLAGYAGNRIGTGLSVLTTATGELQRGRLNARAELETEDELGVLATTFNQMAHSIQSMTDELRSAADEEAALRARLEGVFAGMGEALIAVDDRGRITDFNAAAEELVGVPARDVLRRKLPAICTITDEDGTDLTTRFAKPVVESWKAQADLVPHEGGSSVPVAVSAAPLRGTAGTLTGAVFVVRDVRREREIEKMKTEFISNVSHELRTPLTPVKGYSDILAKRDMPPEKVRHFAQQILNGATQLERVTDQLVQFATLAAGRLQLHTEPVRARDLVDGLVDRWHGRLPGTHQITRRIARGTPPAVLDKRYVEVALDELVDNAVKYSPEGGRIRISASKHENGHGPHLVLSVEDKGVGIDPDRREAIFEDFSQADGSATRQFGGLGLGLALVNRIVRAHGGQLSCTSAPGEGTTVRMLLPVETPAANEERQR